MLGASYAPVAQEEDEASYPLTSVERVPSRGHQSSAPAPGRIGTPDLPPLPPILYPGVSLSKESLVSSQESDGTLADEGVVRYKDGDTAEGEGDEEAGLDGVRNSGSGPNAPSRVRRLAIILFCILLASVVIGFLTASSYHPSEILTSGPKKLGMDLIFNDTFQPKRKSLSWLKEANDGVFSYRNDDDDIILEDVLYRAHSLDRKPGRVRANSSAEKGKIRTLVKGADLKDTQGHRLQWTDFSVSADERYILLAADTQRQWRWSTVSNYYIHDLTTKTTTPVQSPSDPPTISYAVWSPRGASLAYVSSNDLYVKSSPSSAPVRVTTDGTANVFNGVPDWVYEEEVFGRPYALWWSPDSSRIAYLRFDESKVPIFEFPIYNPSTEAGHTTPYLAQSPLKYPKPGYPNPVVSVHLFDLAAVQTGASVRSATQELVSPSKDITKSGHGLSEADLAVDEALSNIQERLVTEVVWVGVKDLLVRETNRVSDVMRIVNFPVGLKNVGKGESGNFVGDVVRRWDVRKEGGWIEAAQTIEPLFDPYDLEKEANLTAYLDVFPSKEGFNHVAYFANVSQSEPSWLTKGEWEVDGSLSYVDIKRKKAYFVAAMPSSIQRHLFSVELPNDSTVVPSATSNPTALTDTSKQGSHSVSFSSHGGYYLLDHHGPDVPWQKVVSLDDEDVTFVYEDNGDLNKTSAQYEMPIITWQTVQNDEGQDMNVKEILPARMDASGRIKYPVLFRVYGGPNSQMVNSQWERDWHHYLATVLNVIVVVVDGRGTGFRGRKFRNPVTSNLGHYEALDVIAAARQWAQKKYCDRKRIGVWGWSYGGYLTAKVVEANSGVVTLGMSVAPVTDWRFYDTIYTERYMKTPDMNSIGYQNSSVHNMTGFANANFLLAHGSGDDNVHFENSANLLDLLTAAAVRTFRFRMFTDSQHAIQTRGAYRELHEFMTSFLVERWKLGKRKPVHDVS